MRKFFYSCMLAGMLLLAAGCGSKDKKIEVVLHTGFSKNEVFRLDKASCSLPEIMVYLTNTQNQYEKVYGEEIWKVSSKEVTLEENIKDMVLAQIAQIKAMTLLAKQEKVELTKEEKQQVQEAAAAYYKTLNETEIEKMGVSEALLSDMYGEYALANKVYRYIIKDINPEISDDEARTITVEHILIKTYSLDEEGNRVEYSESAKRDAYQRAKEIWNRIQNGEKFEQLATKYNEDTTSQYSFRQGEKDPVFEEAAFNLGQGEISEIVETDYGYHIIKCITTFNREETDANKIKIVEQRREEVFGERYAGFVADLVKNLNEPLWEEVELIQDPEVDTAEFFEIYETFVSTQL